jgi:putative colanic acid biosynthesis acetyltransferase WcaF
LKTDLSSYDNSWYKPGSALKRGCWFLINAVIFKSSLFPFYGLKTSLLRMFGARIGKKVLIKPNVNIKYPWFLEVGNHVWIGEQVWIDNIGKVLIGNHVCLSQGCILLSGNHDYKSPGFDLIIKDIVLEDGVWIGAKAIVCGGTIAGDHAVLTTGSVTARELERMGVYSGNPAEWARGREFRV